MLDGAHGVAIAVAIGVAAVTTERADWQPAWLVGGLLAFAVVSNALALNVRGVRATGAYPAVILAAVQLGPAPAVLIGLATAGIHVAHHRSQRSLALSSLATWAIFPVVAALAFDAAKPHITGDVAVSSTVLGIYLGANLLNFACIYGYLAVTKGARWWEGLKNVYAPVLPTELATGVLVVGVVYVDRHVGPEAIALVSIVVLIFQYMLKTSVQAVDRGEQLEERNKQLAALQFGLISTTMKTLALRDHMTARHSAAVARYAREMARELGLSTEEQELFHTAGLFHDIGKFIFPDTILFAGKGGLTDDEYAIVRRHPEVGADLIAEIDGYGPVARIVRFHHERIDGRGYPFGLSGGDIPLGSKIIAVADVYDVLTARDTYRQPVSSADAFEELRRSAGTQLDAELVELFIGLVTRRGVMFSHSSADDFEAELALERRVSDYAAPRLVA